MSLKKGKMNVSRRRKGQVEKGQYECPSKRASWMSIKKGKLNVPQKGQLECPPKGTSWMSLNKGNWNVPPRRKLELTSKRVSWMSLKKDMLNVPQKVKLHVHQKVCTCWVYPKRTYWMFHSKALQKSYFMNNGFCAHPGMSTEQEFLIY